ncbi:MAG TPA: cobyric acid synthase CobQ, partial [Pseudomonadales bacterium]|nr:cobyric acid synthase CobQ [Pseudomonadales bacterium]
VVVPVLPRISNHTDFDALRAHPDIEFVWVRTGQPIPPGDLIILPGSKNVRADLAWLKENGWKEAILKHLRWGGKIIGICGGFQMLGEKIEDPLGLEGSPGVSSGLNLLNISTTLEPQKQLKNRIGKMAWGDATISGYEIHAGVSRGDGLNSPFIVSADGNDGAISADNNVIGTYWHGLFDQPAACAALLQWAGLNAEAVDIVQLREHSINRLADMLAQHMDASWLLQW